MTYLGVCARSESLRENRRFLGIFFKFTFHAGMKTLSVRTKSMLPIPFE
jgi:hypothetical protein